MGVPALILIGLSVGGCSMTYQLNSMFDDKTDASVETTGSIPVAAVDKHLSPSDVDLAFARAAAAEVLTRGTSENSQAWENPATGARGTVTPIASAYTQDGQTCQDFLASYVKDGSAAWMRGEGCRVQQGRWEIRNLKTWVQT
ncbi:MAG TPA: RT0821/Lpp0805 family surface protein [Xanthobacteraceae bacterium]|jgi:surface antigen|nr:RT0821/Lpp0805 family surface protein [Xanthobacteraceae bacterium]